MLFPSFPVGQTLQPTSMVMNSPSSATANTMGSWVEVSSIAMSREATGILFNQDWADDPAFDIMPVAAEVGIGEPGSQITLIPPIPTAQAGRVPRMLHHAILFPLRVKKAQRLWMRAQHNVGGAARSVWTAIQPVYGQLPVSGTLVTSMGFNSATTVGTQVQGNATAYAWGAWTTIGDGGFAHPTIGIIVSATRKNGEAGSGQNFVAQVQIGVGAAGAEVPLGMWSWGNQSQSGTRTGSMTEAQKPFRALRIPAGVRISARLRSNYASSPSAYITIHGVH